MPLRSRGSASSSAMTASKLRAGGNDEKSGRAIRPMSAIRRLRARDPARRRPARAPRADLDARAIGLVEAAGHLNRAEVRAARRSARRRRRGRRAGTPAATRPSGRRRGSSAAARSFPAAGARSVSDSMIRSAVGEVVLRLVALLPGDRDVGGGGDALALDLLLERRHLQFRVGEQQRALLGLDTRDEIGAGRIEPRALDAPNAPASARSRRPASGAPTSVSIAIDFRFSLLQLRSALLDRALLRRSGRTARPTSPAATVAPLAASSHDLHIGARRWRGQHDRSHRPDFAAHLQVIDERALLHDGGRNRPGAGA